VSQGYFPPSLYNIKKTGFTSENDENSEFAAPPT